MTVREEAPVTGWGFADGDQVTPDLVAVRKLGGGSAYEAYVAFDQVTYGPVVVKVLRPHVVDDEHSLRGLRREAETLARVNHPVVVRGLRHDDGGERPHLVLESIDGPRLSTLIRKHGRLAPEQYLPLAIEVAASLHYLRGVDVCHLDIKPSNLIMGAPARLIDLSVARSADRAAEITGIIGSDRYLAPEQADPGGAVGVPSYDSDVWGLGATLFEAVAGYRPFDDGDPRADTPAKRHPQVVEEPYELPASVPALVGDVVYAMLRKDPARRPQPHEVADALAPALEALPKARLSFKVTR